MQNTELEDLLCLMILNELNLLQNMLKKQGLIFICQIAWLICFLMKM